MSKKTIYPHNHPPRGAPQYEALPGQYVCGDPDCGVVYKIAWGRVTSVDRPAKPRMEVEPGSEPPDLGGKRR